MHRIAVAVLAWPLCVTTLWALGEKDAAKSKAPSPVARQILDLQKEFTKEQEALLKAYKASKSEDEQAKILKRYEELMASFGGRFLKVSQEHLKDPATFAALAWIISHQGDTFSPTAEKAAEILKQDFARDPRIDGVCHSFQRVQSPAAEALLRAVVEQNPKKETQARARLALAQMLKDRADIEAMHSKPEQAARTRKEAEECYERLLRDVGDAKGLGQEIRKEAKGDLVELRTLSVGKTAPDIAGKDSSDKSFRLSDYRGKVVVLDFWARW